MRGVLVAVTRHTAGSGILPQSTQQHAHTLWGESPAVLQAHQWQGEERHVHTAG
jgi:hypothetical protein